MRETDAALKDNNQTDNIAQHFEITLYKKAKKKQKQKNVQNISITQVIYIRKA